MYNKTKIHDLQLSLKMAIGRLFRIAFRMEFKK